MKLRITAKGVTPLLMHNERLADSLDSYTIRLAKLTSKTRKTPEDHQQIARVEWEGGLYWSEEHGPFIPAKWIRQSLIEAGRLQKQGAAIERGLQILDLQIPLAYRGPRDFDGMYAAGFFSRLSVSVNRKSRTIRTRPQFEGWGFETEMLLDPTVLDPSLLAGVAEVAGRLIGIGDGRRIGYGRSDSLVEEL